jgi:hypothetical protein
VNTRPRQRELPRRRVHIRLELVSIQLLTLNVYEGDGEPLRQDLEDRKSVRALCEKGSGTRLNRTQLTAGTRDEEVEPSFGPEMLHVVIVPGKIDVGAIAEDGKQLRDLGVVVLVRPL